MREAEWVERLWQQLSQLASQAATKEDLQRLEEQLASRASQETVERLLGKVDTLLINTATKVEVGRIETRMEQLPLREEVQRLETHLLDSLPHFVTKREWSALESRLEAHLDERRLHPCPCLLAGEPHYSLSTIGRTVPTVGSLASAPLGAVSD